MTDVAQTFLVMTRKSDAYRVKAGMRNRNVIAGVRGKRGEWEVYGFVPTSRTFDNMHTLAKRLYHREV